MTAVLHFDEFRHAYSLEGQPLIGVTSALDDAGLINGFGFSDSARMRGTYVHAAIAMQHANDLDLDSLDPVLLPYVHGYIKFVTESGFIVDAFEERVFSRTMRCAGTLDLRGRFPGNPAHVTNIIDIKTGMLPSHVGYQVAGYSMLAMASVDDLPPLRLRWALQLRDDGTYRLVELSNQHDEKIFRAALTIAQAKKGWFK